jgi:hypothetical protein
MTTADVTQEQLLQRRRELAAKVADLTADLESQRETVAGLGVVLRASNIETRASREQKRLKAIRDALFAAERALADFDESHPEVQVMDLFAREERKEDQCQQQ